MKRERPHLSARLSADHAQNATGDPFHHFLEGSAEEKTNPWAIGTATLANGAILAMLLLIGIGRTVGHLPTATPTAGVHLSDFTLFAPSSARRAGGGGGGGSNSLTDPISGRIPRQEMMPIVPPQPQALNNPQLPVDPAIAVPPEIKLPDNSSLPNIGVPKSPNVSLLAYAPVDVRVLARVGTRGMGRATAPAMVLGKMAAPAVRCTPPVWEVFPTPFQS